MWNVGGGLIAVYDDGVASTIEAPRTARDNDRAIVLDSVSCASVNSCVAVGAAVSSSGYDWGDVPYLAVDTDGVWSEASLELPEDALTSDIEPDDNLASVSCPAAGGCAAVGAYDATGSSYAGNYVARGLVAQPSLTDPTEWTLTPAPVPANAPAGLPSSLKSVSCTAISACTAVGGFNTSPTSAAALGETLIGGGIWLPSQLPGTDVDSEATEVSCVAAGECTAIVWQNQSVLDTQVAGLWLTADSIPIPLPNGETGGSDLIVSPPSIDCRAPSECTIAGSYYGLRGVVRGFIDQGFATVFTTTETPQPEDADSIPADFVTGVACAELDRCIASGSYWNAEDGIPDLLYMQTPTAGADGSGGWTPTPLGDKTGLSHPTCVADWGCIAIGDHYGGDAVFVTIPA